MRKPSERPCAVEGCPRPFWARDYCALHLRRFKLYGDPLAVHRPFELKGRLPAEEVRRRVSESNRRRYQADRVARLKRAAEYRQKVGAEVLRRRNREAYQKDPTAFKRSARNRKYRLREAFVETVEPAIVYARSGGICGICQESLTLDGMQIDHVIPIARGGLHCYANVQASHAKCNRAKSDKWEVGT
jgi:5-methylcytosine-specific restriction endonuclease McrA